ncbi:phytanoyl-CoA dioxygenase family protein [bacterium AH-315-I18]|nr:phytanoyl-CoA dioxygenase family protein [bacterium AH-315-I18]
MDNNGLAPYSYCMNTNLKTELETYNRDGFLVVRGAINDEQIQQLTRELTKLRDEVEAGMLRGNHLMENNHSARVVFNPYDHSPAFRDLVNRPDMVERAKAMLGGPIHLHHTKLMCKPARKGSPQPWHQDYYYWQGNKANQVAVFVCIDPSTVENGCLRCIPGSHKGGLREHKEEFYAITGERHWVCEVPKEELDKQVLFTAEPGDLVFFGSLTLHSSEANTSPMSRRAVIFQYDALDNLKANTGWGAPEPKVQWE